jgi:tRNA(fMet)-specific endonuclease VapC
MFVLDTNTLIYFFKGEGGVADELLSRPPAEIAVPSIVLYELRYGILKSTAEGKLSRQLEEFSRSVDILEFGEREAEAAADIRTELEQKGTSIGPYDILIAGISRAHGGILVSRNLKEFRRVSGLQVVDWYGE